MLRILIADDHEVLRRGLLALLEQHADWHVIGEASNGREAVKLALKTRPNVALLDLSMPEMNGLEVTRAIRKELPNTEVLIFTVHESEDLVRDVLAAGARGYLLKTELTHNIVAAIESLAEHKPFFSWQISKKLLDNYLEAQAVSVPSADALTAREREVVQLLAEGKCMKEVAAVLNLTTRTVAFHKYRIMEVLNVRTNAELVQYAIRNHLIAA